MNVAISFGKGVKPLFQAHGLIILNKPAGLKSHPNKGQADSKALMPYPYDMEEEAYVDAKGQHYYLLNRLDSPTSGLLVLSSDLALAKDIRAAFEERKIQKTYLAMVKSVGSLRPGIWKDKLRVQRVKGGVRAVLNKGGDSALTHYRLLHRASQPSPYAMLVLEPKTGRTHQLRVQCAHRRMPILGDATYGDFAANRKWKSLGVRRLMLHAWKLKLPRLSARLPAKEWVSDLPESFVRWGG